MKMTRAGRFLMLGLIGQTLLSLSASADDTAAASTDLTRLHYYPHVSKLYLAPDFQYTPTNLGDPERGGSPGNASSTHSWQADLFAIYGLPIEGLRAGLSESWLIHRWTDTTLANGSTNENSAYGLSDPSLFVQYRIMDATAPNEFALDAELEATPGWGTHDVATTTFNGNDVNGYGTGNLIVTGYWIMAADDVGLSGNLAHDFSGSGVNQSAANASYTRDSFWAYSMTLTDRYHFCPHVYVQASASFQFGYSYDQTNSAPTPVTTNHAIPFHVNPNLLVGFRVLDNMTLDANYTYQNYTTTASGTPATTTHNIVDTIELRARIEL